jgi:hypothetical protein
MVRLLAHFAAKFGKVMLSKNLEKSHVVRPGRVNATWFVIWYNTNPATGGTNPLIPGRKFFQI